MTTIDTASAVQARTRVEVLDALRGVAIFGILLYNIADFTGYEFIAPLEQAALPASGLDHAAAFAREWLVQGKFYSLFSLLFGIGIALQLGPSPTPDVARRVRRRLTILLLIGTLHGIGWWFGDILQTYAVLGFALLLFRARAPESLGRWAVGFLLAPVALYGTLLAVALVVMPAPAPAASGSLPPVVRAAFDAMPHGSYLQVVHGNAVITAIGWVRRLVIMALPRIFGMFLLGMWLVRSGWLARLSRPGPAEHAMLSRVITSGLLVGVPLAALGAWLGDSGAPRVPTMSGWLEMTAESIATPGLALAYASLLVRCHASAPALFAPIAAVGRMALTNYLMHSLVGVLIFYGFGLGYWGTVALVPSLVAATMFYAGQMAFSRWWLQRARYGPIEWIWRQGTYGRRLPLFWGAAVQ